MWIVTVFGFFSVVQKSGEKLLTIRARVRKDLENLVERYLSEASEIISNEGTDYPFRIRVTREVFAEAMKSVVEDIDYPNFKSKVLQTQGLPREQVYSGVWGTLFQLEDF